MSRLLLVAMALLMAGSANAETFANPYLPAFLALPPSYRQSGTQVVENGESARDSEYAAVRKRLTNEYSWAVPTEAAIDAIASRCEKVLDFGAGTGYWDWLLAQKHVEVRAVDDWSWGKPDLWFPVETGTYPWLDSFDDSWCLMMVWPPRNEMPRTALSHWRGKTLIYVGEPLRGNGDPEFFDTVSREFSLVGTVPLPRWWNRIDALYLWSRR